MKRRVPSFILMLIVLTIIVILFYMFEDNSKFFKEYTFYLTAFITVVLIYIISLINKLIDNEKFKTLSAVEKEKYIAENKISYFKWLYRDAFGKNTKIEESEVEVLDHGYDGILEFDNQLPKWWLGLFYLCNIIGVIYFIAYFASDFAHPVKEYEKDVQLATIEKTEYEKIAPKITIETTKFDAGNIKEGEELFKTTCTSCHMEGGAGGIGPNLTDDYWKTVRQKDLYKNVFDVVYNGVQGTQMASFGVNGTLSGRDIEKIAAYVKNLNETTNAANGASPYGNLIDWKNPTAVGTTTPEVKTDSTATKK